MKKRSFYLLMTSLILLTLIVLVFSCVMVIRLMSDNTPIVDNVSSSGQVSSEPGTSSESASDSASSESSDATSSEEVSSSVSSSDSTDEKFDSNPIDAELEEEMKNANTTTDAVEIYNKKIEKWKNVIQREVTIISTRSADAKTEQSTWEQMAASLISEKEKQCAQQGGSAAQLELAGYIYDLYRSRAKDLYHIALEIDPTFTI